MESNSNLEGFAKEIVAALDRIALERHHISDIYKAAEEAGYFAPSVKDAVADMLLTPEQLAKKRKREQLADMYRAQLNLI